MRFKIDSLPAKENAKKAIDALELVPVQQVIIEPFKKQRSKPSNSHMWGYIIDDFVQQGFVNGRQFDAENWHYQLKKWYLPDDNELEDTLPGYHKWEELPDGTLKLTGSTTELTPKGMNNYKERVYAFGAELGIKFHDHRYR